MENQRSPTASQDSYSVRIIVFPSSVCRKTALYRTSATSVCYTRLCKALFSVYTVSETQVCSISTESPRYLSVSQVSLRKCIFKTRKIDKNAFATQIRRYPLSFRPRTAALWTGIADLAGTELFYKSETESGLLTIQPKNSTFRIGDSQISRICIPNQLEIDGWRYRKPSFSLGWSVDHPIHPDVS